MLVQVAKQEGHGFDCDFEAGYHFFTGSGHAPQNYFCIRQIRLGKRKRFPTVFLCDPLGKLKLFPTVFLCDPNHLVDYNLLESKDTFHTHQFRNLDFIIC